MVASPLVLGYLSGYEVVPKWLLGGTYGFAFPPVLRYRSGYLFVPNGSLGAISR